MNWFQFAYRNVMRNKSRSLLTAISIFVAAMVSVFSDGFTSGMITNIWKNFVNLQTGVVRIVSEGYAERERFLPVDEVIPSPDKIVNKLKKIKSIKSVEYRIRFGLLLGSGDKSVEAMGYGVDLFNSRMNIPAYLEKGKIDTNGLLIGWELAEKLGVHIGDELLIATKTSEGGLNAIKLRISGIIKTSISMIDSKMFFMSLYNAKKLLKLGNTATEIYVFSDNVKDNVKLASEIQKILPSGLKALSIKDQLGSMYIMLSMSQSIVIFFEFIIILFASFVITNTMMMNVFERIKEIGMLKSLGVYDKEIFLNFTLEGAIVGMIGGFTGSLAGYLLNLLFGKIGINYGYELTKNVDIPFNPVIYNSASIKTFVIGVIISVVVSALASMFPANRAKKLSPAEAMRK